MSCIEKDNVIYVKPLYIPWSNLKLGKYTLNTFQENIYKNLNSGHDIIAYAPTGGGKTFSLLLSQGVNGEDMPGFVSLYPNNTLLRNQIETVKEIIHDALEGSIAEVYPEDYANNENEIPFLTIFKIPEKQGSENIFPQVKYIALIALSGKYLINENGEPKRDVLYKLTEKIYDYNRRGNNKYNIYVIVFSTPDTFLLLYTGAYMNFQLVGKALHNIIISIASGQKLENLENILRKTKVLTRSVESTIVSETERLLSHPLFVDEFHLYGPYEVDALYAIFKLFKERTNLPIVLSSATPAEDIIKELSDSGIKIENNEIKAETSDSGFPVKGSMEIHLLPINTKRKGITAYFEADEGLISFIDKILVNKLKCLSKDKRALIILDKLWMVTEVAKILYENGIIPHCIASIYDNTYCNADSNVILGSEATTQGVNLGNVSIGALGGVSAEDVIQRLGRIGRKGVNSTVYLAIPSYALDENHPPDNSIDYNKLVEWVLNAYPNYSKRKRDISNLLPDQFHDIRRKLIYSLGIASIGRVSGSQKEFNKINLTRNESIEILDYVIGPPEMLTKFIIFRRTGFDIDYIDPNGKKGKATIGLITRNFAITDINKDLIKIDYKRSRNTIAIRVEENPGVLKGKFMQLNELIKLLKGEIIIENDQNIYKIENSSMNTLVYVGSLGRDLSDYLSYTGEGAVIHFGTQGDYGIIFV